MWNKGHKLQEGKYRIEKKLGEGGFGIVYKAKDIRWNSWVVIKTPRPRLKEEEPKNYIRIVRRFDEEARNLYKLRQERHPNIVRVYDYFPENNLRSLFWKEKEDVPCLVMEFLEGDNLDQRVQRLGPLSEEEVVGYIRQIGEALSVVHSYELVHRDVKPGNIMLPGTGEAILIDFGVVGEISPGKKSSIIMGTHGYAPYEQLNGSGRGPTMDIHALAGSCYYGVTGIDPERNNNGELILPKQINPHISDRLNYAISQGMALLPKDRPQTMAEWLELLDSTSSSYNIPYYTPSSPTVRPLISSTPSPPPRQLYKESITSIKTDTVEVELPPAPRQKKRRKAIVKKVKQLLDYVHLKPLVSFHLDLISEVFTVVKQLFDYLKQLGWFYWVMALQVFVFAGFVSGTTNINGYDSFGFDGDLFFWEFLYSRQILYGLPILILFSWIMKLYDIKKNLITETLLFFVVLLLHVPVGLWMILMFNNDITVNVLEPWVLNDEWTNGLLIIFLLVWALEWLLAWRMKALRMKWDENGLGIWLMVSLTLMSLPNKDFEYNVLSCLWIFVVSISNYILVCPNIGFKKRFDEFHEAVPLVHVGFILHLIQIIGFRLGWLVSLAF